MPAHTHTEGPWTEQDGQIYGEQDGETVLICDVSPGYGDDEMPALTEFDVANARLIASAPDLLAALEYALSLCTRKEIEDARIVENISGSATWIRDAQRAIARARGEK